jgi:hypothetical protein
VEKFILDPEGPIGVGKSSAQKGPQDLQQQVQNLCKYFEQLKISNDA